MYQAAAQWIKHLRLRQHPEGGWYRETYRAAEAIAHAALPRRYRGPRAFSTAIYFLLAGRGFSAFHRLHSDEMWHFYHGQPFLVVDLAPDGTLTEHWLGLQPALGELPQIVVPRGHWFAARIPSGRGCTLLGCTVAPGFDFADFEMADRKKLCARFPQHKKLITELTRDNRQDAKSAKNE